MSRKLVFNLNRGFGLGLEFTSHLGGDLVVHPNGPIELTIDNERTDEDLLFFYSMYRSLGLMVDIVSDEVPIEPAVEEIVANMAPPAPIEPEVGEPIPEPAKVTAPTQSEKVDYKELTETEIAAMDYKTLKGIVTELKLEVSKNSKEAYADALRKFVKGE